MYWQVTAGCIVYTGFDLSGCPGGIHALKCVRSTQDWLSFIIWDRPKTDQKIFLKSIPKESYRYIDMPHINDTPDWELEGQKKLKVGNFFE